MGYAKRKTSASVTASAAQAAPPPSGGAKAARSGAKAASGGSSGSIWNMQIGGGKQKTDMKRVEVLLFVSELADLLEAGMKLGQALRALARQGEELSAHTLSAMKKRSICWTSICN